MRQQWDFFIAHSSTDKHVALSLYHLLCKEAKVFLDSECLLLGDDWDIELSRAQQASLITIVLVSSKTTSAYYQREEIAAAIALARSNRTRHRVVPIYLDKDAPNKLGVPYGLRLKHSLYITNDHTLIACSKELLQLVQRLKKDTDAKEDSSEEYDGQSLKASKTRWVLVLSATIDEINKSRVEAIAEHLRNLSEDTQLTIVKVESGSVMLTIECTEAGFNRLRTFIDDNTLTHINGWNIEEYWTLYERMLTSKTYLSLNQDDAEFYEIVTKFILDMSFVRSWPELQRFIVKTASTKPRDWKLPVLGNHVAGGSSTQLIKAVAAIACLHMSIILIDDMLESDPRGDYHRVGSGNASNMASALQAASLEIIMLSDTKPEVKLITLRNLNEMILNVAIGQALD